MKNQGKLLLFSRGNDVLELGSDLQKLGFNNVDTNWGSPQNTYSGYHFELARGFIDSPLPKFDLANIDGGHVFHLDAPATCILKELCKPGGYMIFDDWFWSLEKSPTQNPDILPKTAKEYDDLQNSAYHMQMVCKAFMDTDSRYDFIELAGGSVVYRRMSE